MAYQYVSQYCAILSIEKTVRHQNPFVTIQFFFKKVKRSKNTFISLEILFKTHTSQRFKSMIYQNEWSYVEFLWKSAKIWQNRNNFVLVSNSVVYKAKLTDISSTSVELLSKFSIFLFWSWVTRFAGLFSNISWYLAF